MDLEAVNKFKFDFSNKINLIIDKLIEKNFLSEDSNELVNVVKFYIQYQDIKDYVYDVLYNKIRQMALYWKQYEDPLYGSYRKILKLIIEIDDEDLSNSIETFLAKDRNHERFFIFVEEKINCNKSTLSCEKLFFSLLYTHNYDYTVTNKFLSIISKDSGYAIENLCKFKEIMPIVRYVSEISKYDTKSVPLIITPLLKSLNSNFIDTKSYIRIISEIIPNNTDHIHELINGYDSSFKKFNIQDNFEKYIVSQNSNAFNVYFTSNIFDSNVLIKNYSTYLFYKQNNRFSIFENTLLLNGDALTIYLYGMNVPWSDKRKVLLKLIEMKHQKYSVSFIKTHPEFKSLLILL